MNRELLRQVRAARSTLAITVAVGVLGAGATIAQMTALSRVVDRAFLGHQGLAALAPLLAVLLGAIVARAGLVWVREVSAQRGAVRVKSALRLRLVDHLLQLGPAYCGGERTGELVATAVEGVERLDAYVSRYLPQVALSLGVPLLIAAYVLSLDWLSAVLLAVTGPIIPLLMILVGSYAKEHMRRQWTALSRMSAHFLDAIQGLPTLVVFGRSAAETERIARVSDEFRVRSLKALRYAFLSGMVLELMSAVAIALVAVALGVRLLNGGITFQRAFLVLLLAPEFYRPLRELGVHRHAGMEGGAAAARIMEILRTPLPLQAGASSLCRPVGPITVELTGVSYTYAQGTGPALDAVSLTLEAGARTALVGRSGAGKSTLANLLLRFADPQCGGIAVNGIPLTALPPEAWHAYVALVPQRPYLFHGSVRDNIRLARPEASDEEVARAAELAGATEFIARLPHGYDSQIGERGARLSAGQAQRLAIARAFLKDAPLLILDEPTSSLDPRSELLIRRALERLMHDRTVLVIAHRLNTVQQAEKIAVLEDGRLVEVGRHAELLRREGSYARLTAAHHEAARGRPALCPAHVASNLGAPSADGARQDGSGTRTWPGAHEQIGPASAGVAGSAARHLIGAWRGDAPRTARVLARLLGFLVPYWRQVALAILLGCATVASNIGLLGTAAYLIAAAALKPLLILLSLPMYIVRVMGVSRAAARYAERLVAHSVTFRLLARLRVWFYARLEPLAPARLLELRSGDVLARGIKDVEELESVYLRVVAPVVVAIAIAALTAGLMDVFSPALAWAALAFLAAAGVGVPLLSAALARGLGKRQIAARAELNAQLVDTIQGLPDLLAAGHAPLQRSRIAALDRALGSLQRRMALVTGLHQALDDLLMNLAVWTLLILAIPLVASRAVGGVYLALLALVILAAFEAVQPLGQAFQVLGRSVAAGERLFEVVDAAPRVTNPTVPLPAPVGHTLEFDGVSFAYADGEPAAVGGISFSLYPGQRIAVVGPSGAGKSTLIRLALRFWDPMCGTIRLDGRDVREYALGDLRGAFGVVAQDTYIFNDTLRGNLLLARPNATDAEIGRALEGAQLAAFVRGLPDGLDTWVGEQGLRLSGGERQRLAIARALLKDAPLLVLDEATANLDALTERALLDTLDALMHTEPAVPAGAERPVNHGRSVLVITHRLVAMERMDEILVLDGGRIVERGTHAALLAAGGLYRQMVDVQNGMLVDVPDGMPAQEALSH